MSLDDTRSAPSTSDLDDSGIDVEQVISSHSRLARNASRDDDDVGAGKCIAQLLIANKALGDRAGVDVGDIGSNSGSALL